METLLSGPRLYLIAAALPWAGALLTLFLGRLYPLSTARSWGGQTFVVSGGLVLLGIVANGGFPFEVVTVGTPPMGPVHLFLDPFAVTWLLLVSWCAATLMLTGPGRGESVANDQWQTASRLALVALSSFVVLMTDAWLQWGLASFVGWLLCANESRHIHFRRGSVVRSFVWLAMADLLWLIGLATLFWVLPDSPLPGLNNWPGQLELSEAELGTGVAGASLLCLSISIRTGLFPGIVWTNPLLSTQREGAWLILIGFGTGTGLLARWAGVLTPFSEVRSILLGLGGMSALLLSGSAWAHREPISRILRVVATQLGIVWMATAADPQFAPELAISSLCLIAIAVILLSEMGGQAFQQRPLGFVVIALFTGGLLGQERAFHAIQSLPDGSGQNRFALLGVSLVSHGVVSFLLWEMWWQPATDSENRDRGLGCLLPWGGLTMVAACLVMLSFLDQRATSGIEGPIVIDSPVPVLSPLITLIALTASWLWPNPTLHSSSEPSMDSSSGSLERLAQHDYYIELACSRFLGGTCSGISKILLALEAVLAQWLSTAAWETRLRFVASEADEMDEESIPQTWVILTWVTVIVLASGLIVGRILFV